jgi:hypothetical protein
MMADKSVRERQSSMGGSHQKIVSKMFGRINMKNDGIADLILFNGKVITVDQTDRKNESLSVAAKLPPHQFSSAPPSETH